MQGKKVVLRRKRPSDAEHDHAWRRDAELSRLDAAPPLTMPLRDFVAIYREEYMVAADADVELDGRRRIRLAIDTLDGEHIGNITLYDIDHYRAQAELGIMIGDKRYWSAGYGADAIETLLEYYFTHSHLERIYLHTLDWNERARRCFAKVGFRQRRVTREGRYQFVEMEIWRRDFLAARDGRVEARSEVVREEGRA